MNLDDLRASTAAAVTVTQVAGLLDADERTIRRACEDGQLPCIRVGRLLRIPREPLLALLTTHTPNSETASTTDAATATHDQDFGGPSNVNGTPHRLCSA